MLRFILWSVVETIPCTDEKNKYFIVVRWNILQISVMAILERVRFKYDVSVLIILSEWHIQLFTYCTIITSDKSITSYFRYVGVAVLDHVSSCWTNLYMRIQWPSLSCCSFLFSLFYLILRCLLIPAFGFHLHVISYSVNSLSVYVCP